MYLQLLSLHWDIKFGEVGISLFEIGGNGRALLSLTFVMGDSETKAQLLGSILWINFSTGGEWKDA